TEPIRAEQLKSLRVALKHIRHDAAQPSATSFVQGTLQQLRPDALSPDRDIDVADVSPPVAEFQRGHSKWPICIASEKERRPQLTGAVDPIVEIRLGSEPLLP